MIIYFYNQQMNIIQVYTCDCNPGYTYKSKTSYNNHITTKRHQAWESKQNNRSYRERITELENQISRLKVELQMWKTSAIQLKQKYEPCDLLD